MFSTVQRLLLLMWNMYNHVKPAYFSLKIMLLFTDFFRIQFWIRIRIRSRNIYFGSESDPDPAKSFGSFRIRFRIHNTAPRIYSGASTAPGWAITAPGWASVAPGCASMALSLGESPNGSRVSLHRPTEGLNISGVSLHGSRVSHGSRVRNIIARN